jgi:hypothetical protein
MKTKTIIFLISALILILILIQGIILFIPKPTQINSNIQEPTYLAIYVGDIDGSVSEDWFYFYDKLTSFHEKNNLPATFSFYPATIQEDKEFNDIFVKMYDSKNIELMQKGYDGNAVEQQMDILSFSNQKIIIEKGQNHFKTKIKELTKNNYVKLPIAYNQIGARVNEDTVKALESLGFKFYFDVYLGEDLTPISSTKNLKALQYGISFTKTGDAGRENKFKTSQEIFDEINTFSGDLEVLKINNKRVIIIWAHQQDFENYYTKNRLNDKKWKIYTQTIEALEKDPNVELVTPEIIYDLLGKF